MKPIHHTKNKCKFILATLVATFALCVKAQSPSKTDGYPTDTVTHSDEKVKNQNHDLNNTQNPDRNKSTDRNPNANSDVDNTNRDKNNKSNSEMEKNRNSNMKSDPNDKSKSSRGDMDVAPDNSKNNPGGHNMHTSSNKNMNHTGEIGHPDGYMMRGGKMMIIKNGQMMPLDQDMTFNNGTKLMRNGSMIKKDGVQGMMREGEHIDMAGNMVPMKSTQPKRSVQPAQKSTEKTSTKTRKDKTMYLVPDSTARKIKSK